MRLLLSMWLVLSAFGFCQVNSAPVSGASKRTLHVVIVGVTKFSIDDYNNGVLELAFQQRCAEIQSFFEDHLGTEGVAFHSFCTPETTTREGLRHFFSIELPTFSAGTLTLIFIMSHGEAASFNNRFLSSDLEIITYDTKATDPIKDHDRQREFTSILLGSELLTWLQRAPAGSTILTFVDTCHAGAAMSLSTSLSQFVQQQFGLGSLVVASSLKDDTTYSASFTKALLNIWGQNGCLDVDTLSDKIYAEMKVLAPITGTEGIPSVPVRYNGPLCLGNFGTDRRLLFIYAGQNANENPYKYSIDESTDAGLHPIIDEKPLKYTYIPIPLDAKKYVVTVKRSPNLLEKFDVDLTSVGHKMIWLDNSVSPAEIGKAGETLAQVAQANGSPASEVAEIRQNTVAIYRAAGLNTEAVRVLSAMQAEGQAVPISPAIQRLAFQPNSAVIQALAALHTDNISAAKELQNVGDFKNAGLLLHAAADEEHDEGKKAHLATQAYVALGAAGDVTDAKALGKEYAGSIAADVTKAKPNAGNFQGSQMLKAIGAQKLSITAAVGP